MEMIIGEDVTIVNIDGLKFSREIFKYLASEKNLKKLFKLIKVENGLVTVKEMGFELLEELDVARTYLEDGAVNTTIEKLYHIEKLIKE